MSSYGGSRLTPSTRHEHPMHGAAGRESNAGLFYEGEQIPVDERSSISQQQRTTMGSEAAATSQQRPAALSTVSSTTSSSYSRSSSISAAAATPSDAAAAGSSSAAPAAASSRGALALPAHPTTPAPQSSESALEIAAGINAQKLSPADFTFGRCLGEGSFARVVLAVRRSTQERFACKIVDKNFVQKMGKIATVMNEKKILTLLHGHIGIVKLAYTFQDNTSLYYVMELAEGGEMFADLKRVGKYDTALVRCYAAQLVEVLCAMHSKSVVHRDLKPENILFSASMHLKLTDFGTARLLDSADGAAAAGAKARRGSFVGTAEYVSPEILRDQPPSCSADLWSLGAILFQLATGRVPFKGKTEYLTFQRILIGQVQWRQEDGVDSELKDLIEKLLVLDPTARLGAGPVEEGYAALRAHAFFRGVDFSSIFTQPVPPRPAPTVIVQESFETNEDCNDADTVDAAEGEEEDNEGADSDEDAFAASAAASASAAAASASAADSVSAEAGDTVSPLPHGPTVSEKTRGGGGGAASAASSRTSTDGQYSNSVWSRFLYDGERIVFAGIVIKRRALFARKRQLILTDRPRLFYVDAEVMQLKKEPNRDYYMKALSTSAYCWCNEINNLQLALKAKAGDSPESAAASAAASAGAAAASTPSSSACSASAASTASASSRSK